MVREKRVIGWRERQPGNMSEARGPGRSDGTSGFATSVQAQLVGTSQRAVDEGQQNRADDGPQGHEDGISGGVGANHQGGHGCHATGQKRH